MSLYLAALNVSTGLNILGLPSQRPSLKLLENPKTKRKISVMTRNSKLEEIKQQ